MKKSIFQMVFRGICFVLFIVLTTNVMAQYDHLSKEQKEQKSIELINEAEYMVEGKVLDYDHFYGSDGKTIYTDISFEVNHWYKGKGNTVIHIIKKGGRIGRDVQYKEHYRGPSLGKNNNKYIVLLKKEGNNKYVFFDKNDVRCYGRYKRYLSEDFYFKGFYGLKFDTNDALNSLLKSTSVKLMRKKKDVGFQKFLNPVDSIIIDEAWLAGSVGNLRAGVGDTLIIKGNNFGTAGNVLFRNGDRPMEGYLDGLDDVYIKKWEDDEIWVIVPSVVEEGEDGAYTSGSGKIIIQRTSPSFEEKESNNRINIEYSLKNFGIIDDEEFYPIKQGHIAREHCLNGMVFTLHKSLIDSLDAITSIDSALTHWARELDITLELEKKQNGDYYFHNFASDTMRNLIRFAIDTDSLSNSDLIVTGVYEKDDDDDYDEPASYWIHRAEIIIARRNDWKYDRTTLIDLSIEVDFYATILHEIGHAIGLDHDIKLDADGTLNYQNLMAAEAINVGIYLPNDRINLEQHSDRAKAGAHRSVDDSKVHVWTPDFFDRFGVETLSEVNSTVLRTPAISVDYVQSIFDGTTNAKLKPVPFNPLNNYDYYWLPDKVEANTLDKTCLRGVKPKNYYVRIKNDACSVSSVYSLPKKVCGRRGREIGSVSFRNSLLIIHPNPNDGHFDIQFKSNEDEEIPTGAETYIGIYDNLGRLQKEHRVNDATLRQTTIDISTLPAGTYWVVWFADGEAIDTQQLQKTN